MFGQTCNIVWRVREMPAHLEISEYLCYNIISKVAVCVFCLQNNEADLRDLRFNLH